MMERVITKWTPAFHDMVRSGAECWVWDFLHGPSGFVEEYYLLQEIVLPIKEPADGEDAIHGHLVRDAQADRFV